MIKDFLDFLAMQRDFYGATFLPDALESELKEEQMLRFYAPFLYQIIFRRIPDREVAGNMYQLVGQKIFQSLHLYDPRRETIYHWLMVAVDESVREFYRRTHAYQSNYHGFQDAGVAATSSPQLMSSRLEQILPELPENQRMAVLFRLFTDWSEADIWTALKVDQHSFENILYQGFERLKLLYQEKFGEMLSA